MTLSSILLSLLLPLSWYLEMGWGEVVNSGWNFNALPLILKCEVHM